MSKRDFKLLAAVFASEEQRLWKIGKHLDARLAHRGTVLAVSRELDLQYPNFDREKFERAALPKFHHDILYVGR